MKRILSLLLFVSLLLSLIACGEKQPEHTHRWEPANCTRGELCWGCYKTQGDALGHDWEDATCKKSKTCSRCGKTDGSHLGHLSDGNGICARCGELLPTVVSLDEWNHSSANKENRDTHTVFGAVSLEFELSTSKILHNGYPLDFVIYDASGVEVARGSWPEKLPYVLGKDEQGNWIQNKKAYTELIPLAPGTYEIKFTYYDASSSSEHEKMEDRVYLPKGLVWTGWTNLVVK